MEIDTSWTTGRWRGTHCPEYGDACGYRKQSAAAATGTTGTDMIIRFGLLAEAPSARSALESGKLAPCVQKAFGVAVPETRLVGFALLLKPSCQLGITNEGRPNKAAGSGAFVLGNELAERGFVVIGLDDVEANGATEVDMRSGEGGGVCTCTSGIHPGKHMMYRNVRSSGSPAASQKPNTHNTHGQNNNKNKIYVLLFGRRWCK